MYNRGSTIRNIYTAFRERALKEDTAVRARHEYVSSNQGGAGKPDSYQLLATTGEGAWKVAVSPPAPKPKTIIFADHLINARERAGYEIELWDKLIANHTVYIWRGSHTSLKQCTPVVCGDEFWRDVHDVVYEEKLVIESALAAQGENVDDYIIVDVRRYNRFWEAWCFSENPIAECWHLEAKDIEGDISKRSTIRNFHEFIQEYIKSLIDREVVEYSTYNSKESLNTTTAVVAKVIYENPRLKHLSIFSKYALQILAQLGANMPRQVTLNLCAENSYQHEPSVASVPVRHLTIDGCQDYLDLSALTECDTLELHSLRSLINLADIRLPPNLVRLTADFRNRKPNELMRLPVTIEVLEYLGDYFGYVPAQLPNLRELTFHQCHREDQSEHSKATQQVDFRGFQFKYLDLSCQYGECVFLPDSLQILKLVLSGKTALGLSGLSNLTHLRLENCLVSLNQLPTSLRSLCLVNVAIPGEANFSRFEQLETLLLIDTSDGNVESTLKVTGIPASIKNIKMTASSQKRVNIEFGLISKLEFLMLENALYIQSTKLAEVNHLAYYYAVDQPADYTEIVDLSYIQHCYSLRLNYVNADALLLPPSLCDLYLESCSIKRVDLGHLNKLSRLQLMNCRISDGLSVLPENLISINIEARYGCKIPALDITHLRKLVKYVINRRSLAENSSSPPEIALRATAQQASLVDSNNDLFDDIQDQQNLHHPTALLNPSQDMRPEVRMPGTNKFNFSGCAYAVTLYHRAGARKDEYRVDIYDKIEIKPAENIIDFIVSHRHLTPVNIQCHRLERGETEQQLKHEADRNGLLAPGFIKTTLRRGQILPIVSTPLTSPDEVSVYENSGKLDYLFDHKHGQLLFTLKDGIHECDIELAYQCKYDQHFMQQTIRPDITPWIEPDLLHPELWKKLHHLIQANPELHFMLDSSLSAASKLELARQYCADFSCKTSKLSPDAKSLVVFLDNTATQTGACLESSMAFMALAFYLSVPVCVIGNEQHAFCQIPFDENGLHYIGVHLSSGLAFDLTPLHTRNDPFNTNHHLEHPASPASPKLALKNADSASSQDAKPTVNYESELAKTAVLSNLIHSLKSLFAPDAERPPIIMLKPHQSPILVNQAIMQILTPDEIQNHLYVHTPEDLKLLMDAVRLENNERKLIAGPLHKLIKRGGILVINWSKFSATELVSYKSILEESATLMGKKVAKQLRIISLGDVDMGEACDAFITRTTPHQFDHAAWENIRNRLPKPVFAQDLSPILEIDLFKQPNWRERLHGKVIFTGNSIRLLDNGALIQAIEYNQPLCIINPSNEAALQDFIEQIKTERKFYHNGEMISVPDNFTITIKYRDNPVTAQNVHVISAFDPKIAEPGIFLNANNLHECYSRLVIDNKLKSAVDGTPYLTQHQNFYITEFISKEVWQEFISHAGEYVNQFTFTLLPGAEIESVAKSVSRPVVDEYAPVIYSNDVYYAAQELADDETEIIAMTPDMTFQQLIARIKDKRFKDGSIEFTYEPRHLLEALQDNKKFVLTGMIDPLLYQQLLPFLYPEYSQLYCNDKRINITGKLQCILPTSAKEVLCAPIYEEANYNLTDYQERLLQPDMLSALCNDIEQASDDEMMLEANAAKEQKIIENIDKIDLLFDLAKHLSHKNLGFPEPPQLTFHHLKRMLFKLLNADEQSLHHNNPIKGFLLYNYPTDSQTYAFLNAVAKYLFTPHRARTTPRHAKVNHLIKKHQIQSLQDTAKYCWELLNCCDGNILRDIVGEDLRAVLTINQGRPELTREVIEKLHQYLVQGLLPQLNSLEEKPYADHKGSDQLDILLKDRHTNAIFVKGPPGASKTFSIASLQHKLPEKHYYHGTIQLKKWLRMKPIDDKTRIVLHLDEANMFDPGIWDLLTGLFRKPPVVYYRGKRYELSPNHIVVFSGNPESFAGRYHHAFFQRYAETLYYKLPLDTWLQNKFMTPVLNHLGITDKLGLSVSVALLWAFHHIKDYNPHMEISLRDIENLMQRFALLYKENDAAMAARLACFYEFATAIPNSEKRTAFITKLQLSGYVNAKHGVTEIKDICIPAEKKFILDAIEQDIAIVANRVPQISCRRLVLLEGNSGVGKSSIFKAILKNHHYKKNHTDPTKRYYEISVDDTSHPAKTLIRALLDGSKVILDEINLSKRLYKLLYDLLDGQAPTDLEYKKMLEELSKDETPVMHPNFQVFATTNSSAKKGRKPLSPAQRNRAHMIYVDDYTREQFISIAACKKHPSPVEFVDDAMLKVRMNHGLFNSRNIFQWMQPAPLKANKLQ